MSRSGHVVYGTVGVNLVFMPRAEGQRLAALHRAIVSAATWGELRSAISAACWQEIVERLGEEPAGEDAFDPHELPGFADCEWPRWPAARMLEWMPANARALGRRAHSLLHGSFLQLHPSRALDVVRALEAEGFRCEDDDELVRKASGSESWGF